MHERRDIGCLRGILCGLRYRRAYRAVVLRVSLKATIRRINIMENNITFFEISTNPDIIRFGEMAHLLHQRRESLKTVHEKLSLTGESKRRLYKALCAEYDALIVAEAQKIVDSYNPDGTPKENCNENYRAER